MVLDFLESLVLGSTERIPCDIDGDGKISTFTGNSASYSGGGICNLGTATVQESTLSDNTAGSAEPHGRVGRVAVASASALISMHGHKE